jgi:hypothetical protein
LIKIIEINAAIKTVDALGQMLRSYMGKTSGDVKAEIARACYDLSMRTVGMIMQLFDDNLESSVRHVASLFEKRNKNASNEEISKSAKIVVFNLISIIGYSMLLRLSSAVGSQKLEMTFDRLVKDSPISYQLIDLSIRSDAFLHLDPNKVSEIKEKVEGKLVADHILTRLVLRHLYLYSHKAPTISRLANIVGIDVKLARFENLRGTDIKKDPR